MVGEVASMPGLRLAAAGESHLGGRSLNEDAVLIRPDLHLYLVADGAGGHNAGNVASAMATSKIAERVAKVVSEKGLDPGCDRLGLPYAARVLAAAVQGANQEILQVQRLSEGHSDMGTTVVAALLLPDHQVLHVAAVGDSRCYRLRHGYLEQLTHDHTLVNDVLELVPDISEDQAKRLPRKVVTRALGMSARLRVPVRSHQLVPGDRFLLCSDGLYMVLPEQELQAVLRLPSDPAEQVRVLVEQASERQPPDNLAALVIHCEETDEPTEPILLERPGGRTALGAGPPSSVPESDGAPRIELMMVDPSAPQQNAGAGLRVVPARPLDQRTMRVLSHIVSPVAPAGVSGAPKVPPPRPPLETIPHTDIAPCLKCKAPIELSAKWCPHCGHRQPQ